MIAPARPLTLLALIPAILSGALLADDSWKNAILGIDVAVVIIALADICSLPRKKRFLAERRCNTVCSLGEVHRVELLIENRSRRTLSLDARDTILSGLRVDPEEFHLQMPARSRAVVHYTLVPTRRGAYILDKIYLRVASRWGLWRRIHRLPVKTQLRVYPDLKQISRYALYARQNRLSLLGVRKTRRIGADNEFERLRDYASDDNHKSIDWRATARRRKLTVRDFQSNHSQRVVFLIDAGRMMMNEASGISLLDHALDAMLMLAHVALARNDQVGLLTFSDQPHHWIPLGSGRRHLNRLVHSVHDLFPRLVESRYDSAFLHLSKHCRKRTMVVLITNVIDQVNAHQIEAHLTNLVGRHLPLGVLLRDHELFDAIAVADSATGERTETLAGERLYRAAAAADILDWRAQVLRNLRHRGALTVDVFPENLTVPLINEYLRVKALRLL